MQEKFRLVYSMIKFTIPIMCCLIIQSQSLVFGNRKNTTWILQLAFPSSALAFGQCRKGRFMWGPAAEQNTPQPPSLLTVARAWFCCLSLGAIGFCFQEEWVTPTAIHGEQRDLLLPASWLSSNQILIGCSHFTTHKQYLAEVKKVNLSCFGERNKDWSAGVKACRQKNCIGNSNYYSQKPHNSDLLG